MRYETILAPLKMEDVDDPVLEHAVALSRLSGARLVLLVVAHGHTRDANAFLREQAEAYLLERASRLTAEGLVVETRVVEGEPDEGILRAAEDVKAGIVVMATHGHGHVRHLLLGSVTEAVLRAGDVPVLLVKAH